MCTQEGIEPMWEDVRNKQGGRWLLSFEKRGGGGRDRDRDVEKRELKDVLDNCWMETVRSLLGGTLG